MSAATHAVTVRRDVSAARERVFEAFQNRDWLARWFSPSAQVEMQILEFQFRPEGAFRFRYFFPDASQSTVKGLYRSIVPPKELTFSWVWEEPDRHAGLVTEVKVDLIARGDSTEVVVTHDRLPDRDSKDRYATGWSIYLDRLTSCLSHESV